jgi:hypothetical protein
MIHWRVNSWAYTVLYPFLLSYDDPAKHSLLLSARYRRCPAGVSDLSNALLNLRFDVLVQAKEVVRIVLLLDGHKPVVVEPERGFNRVFSLLT